MSYRICVLGRRQAPILRREIAELVEEGCYFDAPAAACGRGARRWIADISAEHAFLPRRFLSPMPHVRNSASNAPRRTIAILVLLLAHGRPVPVEDGTALTPARR